MDRCLVRWVALCLVGSAIACSGDDGARATGTVISGVAWVGGPVQGAELTIFKLDSTTGARTGESWSTTTGDRGQFEVNVGEFARSFDLECRGGTYRETASGQTVQRGPAVLRGLALDLDLGERRTSTSITPWSHLVWSLGDSRTPVEDDRLTSFHTARDLLAAHLGGWDPTDTPIASLADRASSATPDVLHAISLAGWSAMARIAVEDGFADVTSETFVATLARDIASSERLFDGSDGTSTPLAVTAACPPPPGCDERGPRCFNSCAVHASTIRGTVANGVRAYLRTNTATGQTAATLASWLVDLRDNPEPKLFPAAPPPEPFDTRGPHVTITAPAVDDTMVSGAFTVEATADDPIGVASLTVEILGAGGRPIVDTDAAADRARGTVDSTAPPLPEGTVTIRATATDLDLNVWRADRTINVNNLTTGTASGVVVKGRVSGATVEIYGYTDGTRGALLGSGVTTANGTFTNIAIADGYDGPLLIEAGGGGAYPEDAAPSGTPNATFDLSDKLRTVVLSYADGGDVRSAVVSPLTTWATTYATFLRSLPAADDFAAEWTDAIRVIRAQFGVTDFLASFPTAPALIAGDGNADRYGLILVGLSQIAYRASTQGGGDAGSYATAMDSIRVVNVLDQDLADGCFDGKSGAVQLAYGGTQRPGDQAVRLDLANAIATYLRDARDVTPLAVADVLPLLDTLASGGPATGTGACPGGGLFETPGGPYDRAAPTIVWLPPTPAEGDWVRDSIMVRATADDDGIDLSPVVSWLDGSVDTDGDTSNAFATATIDTTSSGDGPLTIAAYAIDDSGNDDSVPVRIVNVDNTDPVLTVAPTGFYVSPTGDYWTPATAPILTGTITEVNLVSVKAYAGAVEIATATVAGSSWSVALPAGTVPGTAAVAIRIEARDLAGNTASITKQLRYDDTPLVLALVPTTVRDERGDDITFDPDPDMTIGNVPSYNPTHNHNVAPTVTLGATPAPVCAAGTAPLVVKHAYLLDEAVPAYVAESNRNPLAWSFTLTDDGVGLDLATTAYRVRNVNTDAIVLNWTTLPGGTPILDGGGAVIGRAHTVPLYRVGTTTPSIPALTIDGLYELQLRGRDQLGREVTDARCWNLQLLPSPIYVGPHDLTRQAVSGPAGSGKYGFGLPGPTLFSLADTSPPYDPIASHLLNDDTPGVGLIEFPLWNPTTEAVYVALDLTRPTDATHTKEVYDGYWAKWSESFTDIDCGYLAGPPASPNYTLPGCARYTGFPAPTVTPAATPAAISADYCVRVFEEANPPTNPPTLTEVLPSSTTCTMESTTISRVVVQLPARAAPAAAPRKFWIMPVVKNIPELWPGGMQPYAEHVAGGQVLTGTFDSSQALCGTYVYVMGTGTYHCTRRVTYRRYKALTRASFELPGPVSTKILVSRDGLTLAEPSNLPFPMNVRGTMFSRWSTAEPTLPLPPTAP